jgi:hypothetical protein
MSHSTHVGFNAPPTSAFSGLVFLLICDGGPLFDASCVVGVGQKRTACAKFNPKPLPVWCLPFAKVAAFTSARFSSRRSRVQSSRVIITAGVGHNPDPLAEVRCANTGCGYAVPLRVIPERGQVPENGSDASPEKRGDILHDDVAGAKLANETGVLDPEAAALTREPRAFASNGDILAGEAAANNVNCSDIRALQLSNVTMDGDMRPVLCQHAARVFFNLAERDRGHSRALKPEAESANAAEEVQHAHQASFSLMSRSAAFGSSKTGDGAA